MGGVKNPRVGWVKSGQGTIEEDEINTEGLYVLINVVTYLKMKNPRADPWMGGEKRIDSLYKKLRTKIICISV